MIGRRTPRKLTLADAFQARNNNIMQPKLRTIFIVFIAAIAVLSAAEPPQRPVENRPARVSLPSGTRMLRDIAYVPGGHERQKLDLYLPPQERSADGRPAPLIVWVHGGAWRAGSKDRCPALPLVRQGYAVASINYRLSQHAVFPAQIEDCKSAIRWLRAHATQFGFDPDRIGVWGSSAGGHLVALLGTTGDTELFHRADGPAVSSRVQAVCDWFGPTDFTKMNLAGSRMDHDAPDSPESQLIGGPIQENPQKCAQANPITYVSKSDPPFLIMHGDGDPLVPLNQSELLHEALTKAEVDSTLHVVKGAGHGFGGPETHGMVRTFFDKHLKGSRVATADRVESAAQPLPKVQRPNIVYVLCDDLGYGDVQCLNPDGKIPTPNIDRLAANGMIFTDAHSSSSVCTPTRYGIMTGRYNWRSRLKRGVLGGLSPLLIEPGRLTVPMLLKQHGYQTACVGKWHLGMGWEKQPGKAIAELSIETREQAWNVDFTKPVANGPRTVGFDAYFGISASLDMVPYAFISNDRVTAIPSLDKKFPMVLDRTNGFTREGPAAPEFDAADVLPTLTSKAIEFIDYAAPAAKRGTPFFLYLPYASPHTPILPTSDWQGKSGLNAYADFVMETDAGFGAVLDALDRNGVAENTLVIFASDNGCSPQANYPELLSKGHNPSHKFRGHKADIFEGGHRVPFIVRWPGKVQAGSRSDQLVSLNDLMATCADILGVKLPETAGEDSVSILPVLLGKQSEPLREAVVHHSINGSFAIRQGPWKLIFCPDSGGWSAPRPGRPENKSLPSVQLYNLANDIAETNNLHEAHPDIVEKLTRLLQDYVRNGRSTPGHPQPNTTPIEVHRKS